MAQEVFGGTILVPHNGGPIREEFGFALVGKITGIPINLSVTGEFYHAEQSGRATASERCDVRDECIHRSHAARNKATFGVA
jgi:hypothetical protein